jgi:hypothetical protein
MKSQLNSRILLLFSLILLFQACDWFGKDSRDDIETTKKTSEFVFTVDSLRQFSQFEVNDLDIIDDTSFVISGFFVEDDENGNTKNEYNQIWWGKKKGYEFKSEKLIGDNNYIYDIAALDYFDSKLNYFVFGASTLVAIKTSDSYSYHYYGSNINGDESYEDVELLRPGEFYLYGRNGSLAYYKDGTFSKIDTGIKQQFFFAGSKADTLILYSSDEPPSLFSDLTQYKQYLLLFKDGKEINRYVSDLTFNPNKPVFLRSISPYKEGWIIGSYNGVHTFNNLGEFKQRLEIPLLQWKGDGEGNFIGRRYEDESYFYWDGVNQTVLPSFESIGEYFKTSAYKGRLWVQIILKSKAKLVIGEQQ